MTIQIDTIALPSFWASALVNGDYSGLDDVDAQAVLDAIAELRPWYVVSTEGEPYYRAMQEMQDYVIHCVETY